ncbi:MAG: hypothetical protein ACREUZ_21525, partial [Burkholderiales bacterium]
MQRVIGIWTAVALFGAVLTTQVGAQGSAAQFVGTWIGTWEGNGNGGFELTLEKGSDATLGGRVSVTGEPTYTATLKRVTFDGPRMTAVYDFPQAEGIEIALAATFDDKTAAGTWTATDAGGADVASGAW